MTTTTYRLSITRNGHTSVTYWHSDSDAHAWLKAQVPGARLAGYGHYDCPKGILASVRIWTV